MQKAEIKKQIEYYLSNSNLEKDDFFRDTITSSTDGYVPIENFLKCNKVKKMNITIKQIAAALQDSTELELNEDEKMVRRTGNKALPTKTGSLKKREQKVAQKEEKKNNENGAKEEKKEEENDEPIPRDE